MRERLIHTLADAVKLARLFPYQGTFSVICTHIKKKKKVIHKSPNFMYAYAAIYTSRHHNHSIHNIHVYMDGINLVQKTVYLPNSPAISTKNGADCKLRQLNPAVANLHLFQVVFDCLLHVFNLLLLRLNMSYAS